MDKRKGFRKWAEEIKQYIDKELENRDSIHYVEIAYRFGISPGYAKDILLAIANDNSDKYTYIRGYIYKKR